MSPEKPSGLDTAQEARKPATATSRWAKLLGRTPGNGKEQMPRGDSSSDEGNEEKRQVGKWSFGILNDKETDEVPGSVVLMSKASKRNEPLGLQHRPVQAPAHPLPSPGVGSSNTASARTAEPRTPPPVKRSSSTSNSTRSTRPSLMRMLSGASRRSAEQEKKTTADGTIILEPQPEDTLNDPLNWPEWRRDVALLSLGFYCAWGGGMTPVLAAAFTDVAETYSVSVQSVALTTGFYMCGLAIGSVIASPTAILIGKRTVYLIGAILYIVSAVWCALSPNYASLVVARIFMGLAISPVECLPSATIAEIFYLHERAYRLGVYTLLLLGGKNLIPLISAAISNSLGWRWVFWFIAVMGVLCFILLFFFVPESFWDRTPRQKNRSRKNRGASLYSFFHHSKRSMQTAGSLPERTQLPNGDISLADDPNTGTIAQRRRKSSHHVGFADPKEVEETPSPGTESPTPPQPQANNLNDENEMTNVKDASGISRPETSQPSQQDSGKEKIGSEDVLDRSNTIALSDARNTADVHNLQHQLQDPTASTGHDVEAGAQSYPVTPDVMESGTSTPTGSIPPNQYTQELRFAPPKTYVEMLKPWTGRIRKDKWWKAALRPFILFAYPSILWSSLIYSLSIGWLIVISEAVATIYRNQDTYNFSALQCGLVYLSPFIGGVLGTAVAGKVSDLIVRWMARRNDGVYEPEFRLVMGVPILITTAIGLMGFGWSAEERDNFMVPTVMFGVLSFGCSLGSTTAITFAVDSYRQYAAEALVTLNFSKNFLHGFLFSLFFPQWMEVKGPKATFQTIGGIQIACVLTTIPMYIYGKRARMWTSRKNMMGRF